MLPKLKRLNLKKDFSWVAAGKKIEGKFVKLFIRIGENKVARVGIATSSKNFRKAKDRNRARRVTSSAFEALFSKLPDSINIVALPKASAISVKSGDVLLDLEEILQKVKII